LLLPVWVAVAFITLKSCGGRGCHSILPKLIILGLFRFINSLAPEA
jgi:hypothetical protein